MQLDITGKISRRANDQVVDLVGGETPGEAAGAIAAVVRQLNQAAAVVPEQHGARGQPGQLHTQGLRAIAVHVQHNQAIERDIGVLNPGVVERADRCRVSDRGNLELDRDRHRFDDRVDQAAECNTGGLILDRQFDIKLGSAVLVQRRIVVDLIEPADIVQGKTAVAVIDQNAAGIRNRPFAQR